MEDNIDDLQPKYKSRMREVCEKTLTEAEREEKRIKGLGVFIGQSETKLVRGRRKYRIDNTYPPVSSDPEGMMWVQEQWPKEFSELEKMYHEFCEKAYMYITCHPDHNGSNHVHRILFPDFYYEVIPERFNIE